MTLPALGSVDDIGMRHVTNVCTMGSDGHDEYARPLVLYAQRPCQHENGWPDGV
jgi:hypothetical protein